MQQIYAESFNNNLESFIPQMLLRFISRTYDVYNLLSKQN